METGVDTGGAAGGFTVSHGRRLAIGLGLVLAAGVVVAIVLSSRSSSPRPAGSTGGVAGAAIVRRRNLVETDTESGTLGYAGPQMVYDRLSGTVTWLPAVGQVIQPGQTLYSIDGRPVVLFDGALPAYRTLKAKDSAGQDILQLNRDLVQMGFADGQITVDDTWQAGTTDAVERWQASLGEKETGEIALGRIVFLPGAQRVTQLETTCGSTGAGASAGASSGGGSGLTNGCGVSEASAITPEPHPEFVDLTTTTTSTTTPSTTPPATTTITTPTTTTTPTSTTPGHIKRPSGHKPRGSGNGRHRRSGSGGGSGNGNAGSGRSSASGKGSGTAGSTGGGSGSGSGKGSSGSGSGKGSSGSGSGKSSSGSGSGNNAGGASVVLETTSTELVVTVDLDPSKQSEAKVGDRVVVEMPAGNNVTGTITAVSPVASSTNNNGGNNASGNTGSGSNGGSSGSAIPVTIALSGHHSGAGLDQASVSVNFAEAEARHVLSVPVTALLATPGGGYAVQEAAVPRRLIPVRTGLFAAGYVQISGAGVYPGLQVTDSQG
jgi:hypothetical protein